MKFNPALTLGLIGLALATPSVMAEEGHDHGAAGHEAHADHMLEGYAVVSTALYKDDLAAAKKAAAGMVKHDKDSAMAKHAQAIADSKSIDGCPQAFQGTQRHRHPDRKEGENHACRPLPHGHGRQGSRLAAIVR